MVIINDKKYSIKTLGLLTGQMDADIEKVPENILIIAQVVDDPDSLPYLLETLKYMKIDDMEKFRFVLLRVQIDSQLHLNEDMEKYHKRLFVSQVIEKLIYGELLLEAGKEDEEDEDED
ncbi:MAG: hypothetical protein O8C61_09290 [Candidatus Methanoperedens sp.]|nr:hypothetical protein [Candidatus Methanoperedens sp.]